MQEVQSQEAQQQETPKLDMAKLTKEAIEKVHHLEADLVQRMNAAIDGDKLLPLVVAQAAIFQGVQLLLALVADNGGDQQTAEGVFDQVAANVRQKVVVERFGLMKDAIDQLLKQSQAANDEQQAAEPQPTEA